ncbi:MAG TPA: cytochrome c-type biogenesis protein [Gaiella sp.]|jgi:cytochrome c-type biogenesis protein CcmH|nr:cytochrome c-type biogenesis protein [Gaiella sp.]
MRAGLLVAVVVAFLAAAGSAGGAPSPSDLEAELVCPTCKTTLDQSDAPIARRMKQIIRTRLSDGATEKQIKAELVAQFGPGVVAEPPKSGFDLLAWLVPLGILAAGALGVGAIAWGWSRRRGDEPPDEPLDPAVERRLDAELERYDG